MKDSKKFLLWILIVVAIVVLGPLLITSIFLMSSNYISPLIFIGLLVIAAAIISYFGHIGR